MRRKNKITSFCLVLLGTYVLLVFAPVPFPVVKEKWGSFFRNAATDIFQPLVDPIINTLAAAGCKVVSDFLEGETIRVEFEPMEKPERVLDTDMIIIRPDVEYEGKLVTFAGRNQVSSWHKGFVPIAMFLALLLATPVRRRRKVIALILGLMLVIMFIAGGLILALVKGLTDPSPIALFELSKGAGKWLDRSFHIACIAPVTTFVIPTLIWMLVTFPGIELSAVFGAADSVDTADPADTGHPASHRDPR